VDAIPRDWADPEGWVETALAQLARQHWTLMVLHDVRSGAMRHLDRFLVEVAAAACGIIPRFVPAHHLRTDHGAAGGFRQPSIGTVVSPRGPAWIA
jgi:hypothetical protein